MKRFTVNDIRGPLVPGAGIVLGAAGRRRDRRGCPEGPGLCQTLPGSLSASGCCPCGSIPRPL